MLVFDFWASFDGKMGVATTCAPNDVRPPNPTKSWPTVWTFWANHNLEIMFSKFSGLKTPPLSSYLTPWPWFVTGEY